MRKNKNKIAKFKYITKYQSIEEKSNTFVLHNPQKFVLYSLIYIEKSKKKYYINNIVFFYMISNLVNFENKNLT